MRLYLFTLLLTFSCAATARAADRPNILWITAEDMSPTLGCYGDAFATTPHIDKFAARSVRYTKAFATAPVCSPARSCIINGVYAQSQGTHNMRSAFPIPEYMTGFPSFLRKAGYYTTNNGKTDYNSANAAKIIAASWDDSSDKAHWRNRPDKTRPFFSVFNLMTSHQSRSMVWPYEKFKAEVQSKLKPDQIHDPAKAPLPPYYVDTPIVRKTVARFYDCVTAMDAEVGAILAQLEEDGLADDTIVFFYSDHGSGMPRHKRALLDSGMHVPLIVHFPKKWQHLAEDDAGKTNNRLVSFVDFAPTVLALAGVLAPEWMQGGAFLGPDPAKPRQYVYGHRDRVDEVFDMARSVRDGKYLYIRNYMPHLGYNQPTAWPDLGAIRHEFYRLTDKDKMTPAQWHFAGPTRPIEELYDCEADPKNLKNLAGSPEHAETLKRMRGALRTFMIDVNDLGLIPEATLSAIVTKHGQLPYDLARTERLRRVEDRFSAAELVGRGDEEKLIATYRSGREHFHDTAKGYWAVVALIARADVDERTVARVFGSDEPSIDVASAVLRARHDGSRMGIVRLVVLTQRDDLETVLAAARAIELLGEKATRDEELAPIVIKAMQALDKRMAAMRAEDIPATVVQSGDKDMAMFIGFSTKAFLDKIGER